MPERILLFIPMYNCERQIVRVIDQFTPEVRPTFAELLVIDNRSKDNGPTAAADALSAIADMPWKVVVNDENYGLGGSQKAAFSYALDNGFDYVAMLHGDDQGSVADLMPQLAAGRHRDVDALLGARFMRGSRLEGYSAIRTWGNRFFNFVYSVVTGANVKDLGSGLNLYKVSSLADRWWLRAADNLTFNYDMILRSAAARWTMRFFPLTWREADQVSNVKLVSQSITVTQLPLDYLFRRRAYLDRNLGRADGRYTFRVFRAGGGAETQA